MAAVATKDNLSSLYILFYIKHKQIMSLSIVATRTKFGMDSPAVRVEVHISAGLPKFHLVGLPEKAVNESKERVRSAIINSGLVFPTRRVTVNLAPADLPKEGGGGLDLAISIGILIASKQLDSKNLGDYEFLGELALSGEVLPVRGFIPAAMAAKKAGKAIIASKGNSEEASLLKDLQCFPCGYLFEAVSHLNGTRELSPLKPASRGEGYKHKSPHIYMSDIRGQKRAKRSLCIAAAGGHNMLMSGPPGSGKTMLARRLPGLLPPLSDEDYLEVLCIHSLAGRRFANTLEVLDKSPPFRSPHHTATAAALAGGGSNPMPGEISLAHKGVLFLDELPEFPRAVLETLRQPIEAGNVTIARASKHIIFPAEFQLLAAMNPCPCGNLHHPLKECRCSPDKIASYRSKISAPWLDRIDLQVDVPPTNYEDSFASINKPADKPPAKPDIKEHEDLRQMVLQARLVQLKRTGKLNAKLEVAEIEKHCALSNKESRQLIQKGIEKLGLSLRAVHRIMKVARTIADMEAAETVEQRHLAEALSYRFATFVQ